MNSWRFQFVVICKRMGNVTTFAVCCISQQRAFRHCKITHYIFSKSQFFCLGIGQNVGHIIIQNHRIRAILTFSKSHIVCPFPKLKIPSKVFVRKCKNHTLSGHHIFSKSQSQNPETIDIPALMDFKRTFYYKKALEKIRSICYTKNRVIGMRQPIKNRLPHSAITLGRGQHAENSRCTGKVQRQGDVLRCRQLGDAVSRYRTGNRGRGT